MSLRKIGFNFSVFEATKSWVYILGSFQRTQEIDEPRWKKHSLEDNVRGMVVVSLKLEKVKEKTEKETC